MNQEQLAPFLRYAAGNKVGGIVVAVLCFGIGALGFADKTASIGLKLGLAIPFGVMGLVFLVLSFRPPEKHPAIVALRDHAQKIVWVYPGTLSVNGRHSQTFINFGLDNGKRRQLAIGARNDPRPLMELAEQLLPQATLGFSPEMEKAFKKNPSSFRRG